MHHTNYNLCFLCRCNTHPRLLMRDKGRMRDTITTITYVILVLVTLELSRGGLPGIPSCLTINNDMGDGISVFLHCCSRDDDFGEVLLKMV